VSKATALLAKELQRNGVVYSKENDEVGSLNIELAQLFSNANCAMTDKQKDWRANPFPTNALPSIHIALSDAKEVVLAAWDGHAKGIDEGSRQAANQAIASTIAKSDNFMSGIQCIPNCTLPMITLEMTFENSDWPIERFAKEQFNLIQLFALEVHRIFGGTPYRQSIRS
jgi:hypothetical protein